MLKFIVRTMSSKNARKLGLNKKLNKRIKEIKNEEIQQVQKEVKPSNEEIQDIEDIVQEGTVVKSIFFSPLQTRRQRLANARPINEVAVPAKGRKLETIEKEKESTTKDETNLTEEVSKPIKATSKAGKKAKAKEEKIAIKVEESSPLQEEKNGANEATEEETSWEPEHWKEILDNIRKMRIDVPAPVDTMGCEACADKDADEKTQRFHKLVALMLSSQTKDDVTFEAMKRLKANVLTPASIVQMPVKKLEELLYPVGFYKNKAKYIQKACSILMEKYDSDIPNNVKDLIALPGVGPKMAHICMATAWNETTGIGVDVHVHRISNRLRWLPKETKEPEQTRMALEAWLPRHLWSEVNYLLVGFGQTICTPVKPHCDDCLNRFICPSAYKTTPKKRSATRSKEANEDISPAKRNLK